MTDHMAGIEQAENRGRAYAGAIAPTTNQVRFTITFKRYTELSRYEKDVLNLLYGNDFRLDENVITMQDNGFGFAARILLARHVTGTSFSGILRGFMGESFVFYPPYDRFRAFFPDLNEEYVVRGRCEAIQ